MRPLIDDLQLRHLLPLTRLLFPEEGGAFTKHHSFMVPHPPSTLTLTLPTDY